MRRARWLAAWKDSEEKPAIYHCVNRVVDSRFVKSVEEELAAAPGEVFHGWGGDWEQRICGRCVCGIAGEVFSEAEERGTANAWQWQGSNGDTVERA